MHPIEIIVIAMTAGFLLWFIIASIIRKRKGLPSFGNECASTRKGKALVAAYKAEKKRQETNNKIKEC